jgi:hypothetical protein
MWPSWWIERRMSQFPDLAVAPCLLVTAGDWARFVTMTPKTRESSGACPRDDFTASDENQGPS